MGLSSRLAVAYEERGRMPGVSSALRHRLVSDALVSPRLGEVGRGLLRLSWGQPWELQWQHVVGPLDLHLEDLSPVLNASPWRPANLVF